MKSKRYRSYRRQINTDQHVIDPPPTPPSLLDLWRRSYFLMERCSGRYLRAGRAIPLKGGEQRLAVIARCYSIVRRRSGPLADCAKEGVRFQSLSSVVFFFCFYVISMAG